MIKRVNIPNAYHFTESRPSAASFVEGPFFSLALTIGRNLVPHFGSRTELGYHGVDAGQLKKSISQISGGIHAKRGDSRTRSTNSVLHVPESFLQLLHVKSRVKEGGPW